MWQSGGLGGGRPSQAELATILAERDNLTWTFHAVLTNLDRGHPLIKVVGRTELQCPLAELLTHQLQQDINSIVWRCSVLCTNRYLVELATAAGMRMAQWEMYSPMYTAFELSQVWCGYDHRLRAMLRPPRIVNRPRLRVPPPFYELYLSNEDNGRSAVLLPHRNPWSAEASNPDDSATAHHGGRPAKRFRPDTNHSSQRYCC